jgi:hypothetical protein
MMWEYSTALPYLSAKGILSSHDVRTIVDLRKPFQRNPFSVFCERHRLRSVLSFNLGIAMRAQGVSGRPDARSGAGAPKPERRTGSRAAGFGLDSASSDLPSRKKRYGR